MGTLAIILSIISLITALLLTVVILMQNPKGAGGLGALGGNVSEAMFGASAGSALVKITVVLACVFLISTLLYSVVVGNRNKQKSVAQLPVAEQVAIPAEAAPAPAAPAEAAPAAPAEAAPAAK
jgi:preprotein translocase subunit SecG